MRFNWDEFKEGKFAVHCKTEEEEVDFCKQMHEHGMKYKILEWSDYMQKKFTKSDLKDGMVVEYNDNYFRKRLVIGGFLTGEDGYADLGDYNENLKSVVSDLEIVRVYKIKCMGKISSIMKDNNLELIWEREKPKKMTVE